NDPFHNLSHHSEVLANIDRLAQLNEYHTRTTIAYFLGKLRDTPDGDGTLLDHSVVLYGSGMSNSNQHDHEPLPILLAGGASGRLAGGRHIRAGEGTPMANLLLALLHKLDVPAERFGDSTGVVEIGAVRPVERRLGLRRAGSAPSGRARKALAVASTAVVLAAAWSSSTRFATAGEVADAAMRRDM